MSIDRDAVLKVFLAETAEELSTIEQGLVKLENEPADPETLQEIFRMAHSLKGNAACFGFDPISGFAHVVEDVLEAMRNHILEPEKATITLLLKAVDVLRGLVPKVAEDEDYKPDRSVAKLEKELKKLLPQEKDSRAAKSNAPTLPKSDQPTADAEPTQEPEAAVAPAPKIKGEVVRPSLQQSGTLRVGVEKLDMLLNLVGEIIVSRGQLDESIERKAQHEELQEIHRESDRLHMDLQELVMKVRMVPIENLFRQYSRTVRDLASNSDKLAHLFIEGGDVEVDNTVIEHLRDPLTHMIRNAIDHGIEPGEERKKQDKNPCGRILLKAAHEAGMIVITVSDDGAGLNRDKIAKKAARMALHPRPESLSDEELYGLIFHPGFSTAERVTGMSGRGVGMDVVKRNIDALRGSIRIDSRPGEGSVYTIHLPLTLAIIEGFSVGVSGETYVLPLESVIECVELPAEDRGGSDEVGVINMRGQPLPYMRLAKLFGDSEKVSRLRENVVVIRQGDRVCGLVVDELFGENQTVIKPLGKLLEGRPGIGGTAVLGNGRVAWILDPPSLMEEIHSKTETVEEVGSASGQTA